MDYMFVSDWKKVFKLNLNYKLTIDDEAYGTLLFLDILLQQS